MNALFRIVFVCIPAAAVGRTEPERAPEAEFPAAWQGVWKGDAEVRGADASRPPMKFKMELHVGALQAGLDADPKPRRPWTIVYEGDQGRQERKYHLVVRDADKGVYEIDERNSIVLPATLVGDSLVCPFEVGGVLLVSTYRFEAAGEGPDDDRIVFEIISVGIRAHDVSGGKDGVPEVKGFPVSSVQRSVLRRDEPVAGPEAGAER